MLHQQSDTIIGSYNFLLVGLSIVIAIFASSVAFTLAGRMRSAEAGERKRWLLAGAAAMGIGIWSMHFTGMLAYDLAMPVKYDLPTVALSLLAAIGAAAVALNVIYQRGVSWPRIITGGVFMGAGIGAMHYVGMYAMRLEAHTRYDVRYFALSVVVAVSVAILALWFAAQSMDDEINVAGDMVSGAILMGLGIASMHYTAMFAAAFEPTEGAVGSTAFAAQLSGFWVGGLILATLVILGVALRVGRNLSTGHQSLPNLSGQVGD
jgi:methyl-accepting chemotaxis protein PixJ